MTKLNLKELLICLTYLFSVGLREQLTGFNDTWKKEKKTCYRTYMAVMTHLCRKRVC